MERSERRTFVMEKRIPQAILLPRTEDSFPWGAADRQLVPTYLEKYGYEEEEYLYSGEADVYTLKDGQAQVKLSNAPYTNRFIIRKPKDPKKFSGNVVVELLNSTNSWDVSPMWCLLWQKMLHEGDNIGATQSTGYEFSLNTVNLTGPFKWNTTLNISSYKDRWKERNPDVVLAPYEKEDAPIRAIYGCVSDGILQIGETPPASMPDLLPGQMKVKDLNGFDPNDGSKLLGHPDGKIDAADRIYLGSTDPKVIIGFGNMLEYKNFDLNIFFYGMFGQYVANSNRAKYGPSGCEYILQRQNYSKEVLERWTPDNPTNKFPSGFYSAYYGGDDWLLEKVSFVRCKNITLGYSFPHKWIHKVFSQARIYVDVENPFIITNYQGLDPEMDSKGGYPSQRTYSIGIDITF